MSNSFLGIAESHTRNASQPWSPSYNPQSTIISNQQHETTNHFSYPSDNLLSKWTHQDYSPWNQPTIQDQRQAQIPMTHDGIDNLRQRLMQSKQLHSSNGFNQRSSSNTSLSPYSSSQRLQQQNFTDL